jgi:hypothetical protein
MSRTPEIDRRRFCGIAAATAAAGPLGLAALSRRIDAMTHTLTEAPRPLNDERADIRPFHVHFTDEALALSDAALEAMR